MNFLAHLFLADPDPGGLIGSILPDLVRGAMHTDLDPDISAAADLHRRIDRFTDAHPLVARSKQRLFDQHGRYTGILIDIHYDHCLASDFSRLAGRSLPDFTRRVYDVFSEHADRMPESMRLPVAHMIEHDWLGSYAKMNGVELALRGLSARLSDRFGRDIELTPAVADLRRLADPLRRDFDAFFPELCRHVAMCRAEGL